MHRTTPRKEREGETQRVGWLAYTVSSLLLISAGLELLAHQVFGQTDMDTLLWALSLGFWTYVLGFAGFLILSIRWLVDWRHVGASRRAMNQSSITESKRGRFDEHELENLPHVLEQGVISTIPGRSSWDGTKAKG
jgi:hypothetical protein